MLRGLTTVSFWADDPEAAKDWYAELLGIEPYFRRPVDGPPAYVEFRLGDYGHELGLIDRRYAPDGSASGPAGAVAYWHVDDVGAALEKLLSMGAKEHGARRGVRHRFRGRSLRERPGRHVQPPLPGGLGLDRKGVTG